MKHSKVYYFLLACIILMIAACGPVSTAAPLVPDINQLNTAIAQTVAAAVTQSMVPPGPTSAFNTQTATPTFTATFTPTSSPTTLLLFTPTLAVPIISVSVPTNCRNGPGKIYAYQGALFVGQVAQVVAAEPTGKYWYIPNPDSPGNFCWVWGQYATITGNTLGLPVFTPPPTPTPTVTPHPTQKCTPGAGIQISYSSTDTCSGMWWVEFKLMNNGNVDLRSINVEVFDSDTHVTVSNLTDGYRDKDGCSSSPKKDVLSPGSSVTVSAPAFSYNPAGHEIELTVTACSHTGQTGLCSTRKIEFVP
jgi:hypothetical protein